MNILGICLSPGKGGLELYAGNAILALHKSGHQCHFALSPNSLLSDRKWPVNLLELEPAFRQLPLLTARKLARYIDKHQIDIIHMHWNKDLVLAALAKALSRRKPKLVYSRHMEITRSKKDWYHRLVYGQVDRMLVIANFVQEQAIHYLPLRKDQVTLLYLGVKETSPVSVQECDKLIAKQTTRDNDFTIGMIGRIEPYKGQHVLLKALAILQKQQFTPRVVMAGAIMDQAYFDKLNQQIRESGLADQVHYLGMSQEPGRLMSCCDVVVLTTQCETFGLVLAEAMRAGTAVIGTRAGGVPEIIRPDETGMLFEPGNATQLANCLADLIQDQKKRESIAVAGKAFADNMFDETNHFKQLEAILATI